MNKKKNKWDLILIVLWIIVGVAVLTGSEVTKVHYFCIWFLYVLHLIDDYLFGNYNYERGFYDGAMDAMDKCKKAVEEICDKKKESTDDPRAL